MIVKPFTANDKLGRPVILRNAGEEDAENLIKFMKITTAETPYLIREPDEFLFTVEQERNFIKDLQDNPKALMLIAEVDGEHVGNCSFHSIGTYRRYAHRCEMAIALYQRYCGAGIGRILLENALKLAKEAGYEQAELEVIAANERAVTMYQKMGFQRYGVFPHNMKYSDGTYADALWMMKKL